MYFDISVSLGFELSFHFQYHFEFSCCFNRVRNFWSHLYYIFSFLSYFSSSLCEMFTFLFLWEFVFVLVWELFYQESCDYFNRKQQRKQPHHLLHQNLLLNQRYVACLSFDLCKEVKWGESSVEIINNVNSNYLPNNINEYVIYATRASHAAGNCLPSQRCNSIGIITPLIHLTSLA